MSDLKEGDKVRVKSVPGDYGAGTIYHIDELIAGVEFNYDPIREPGDYLSGWYPLADLEVWQDAQEKNKPPFK